MFGRWIHIQCPLGAHGMCDPVYLCVINTDCLTGRRALVINFTCDVIHMSTYFLLTAIIGMYACVA